MEYVTVKSYDGKLVKIPKDKLNDYLKKQKEIKKLLKSGKTIEEISDLLNKEQL